ncbi:MAG: hypothetical protein WBW33_16090 [Bryobacteraceae bacterium]
MKKNLLLGFVALTTTAFAATSNSLKVNVFQDSVVDGKTLKAGDYKISMENGNAVIKQGKESIEVPAREETEANKFARTELIYQGDGKNLKEIDVAGTHTKIIFEEATATHQGQ